MWGVPPPGIMVEYKQVLYLTHVMAAIVQWPDVIEVDNIELNGFEADLVAMQTAGKQQFFVFKSAVINYTP
jgi:hypothetical protein